MAVRLGFPRHHGRFLPLDDGDHEGEVLSQGRMAAEIGSRGRPPRDLDFPPKKEMTEMDAFRQMMGRMVDR